MVTKINIDKDIMLQNVERNIMADLFNRKVKVENNRLKNYTFNMDRFMKDKILREGHTETFYLAHKNKYEEQRSLERKYGTDITGIRTDELNEVVRTGCTRYSKGYTTVYDLSDSLAFILANLFMGNIQDIKEGIERNAGLLGLTYKEVSRGLLSYDKNLMKDLTLEVFLDVNNNMDKFFCSLYENVEKNSAIDYFGNKIDLTGYNLTKEEKIITVFSVLVLRYMDFILSHIVVSKYRPLKARYGSKLNIVSRGMGNIIIYGDEDLTEEHDVVIESSVGNMIVRCLTTEVCKQYERLGEDYCYYVET